MDSYIKTIVHITPIITAKWNTVTKFYQKKKKKKSDLETADLYVTGMIGLGVEPWPPTLETASLA